MTDETQNPEPGPADTTSSLPPTPEATPAPPVAPVTEEATVWPVAPVETPETDAVPEADEAAEPSAAEEWAIPEPPPATPVRRGRAGRIITAATIIVLSLALLACCAWAVKLHRDKQQLQATVDQTLSVIGKDAPGAIGKEISALQADLAGGDLDAAGKRVQALNAALNSKPGDSGGPHLPPEAFKDLPPGADTFFRAHEDLMRKFLFLCDQSRKLKEQGQNVDELRKMRDSIIEAGRLAQEDLVKQRMLAMAAKLGGGPAPGAGPTGGAGGPVDPARAQLQQKFLAFQAAARQAEAQHRDLRAAAALMHRSEEAVKSGDFAKAGQLLEQATEAAKRAPRALADGSGRAMPGLAGKGGPQVAALVRSLFQIMSLEERNLSTAWEELTGARKLLASGQPAPDKSQAVGKMIDGALAQMKAVASRRKDFTSKLRDNKGKPVAAPLGNVASQETMRQRVLRIIEQRVSGILDKVQALSPEEYAQQKPALIRDLLKAVFEPARGANGSTTSGAATKQGNGTAQQAGTERLARIRSKLQQMGPMISQAEIAGQDTAPVKALVEQARKALAAGDLPGAEQATDKALQALQPASADKPSLHYSKPPSNGGGATTTTPPVATEGNGTTPAPGTTN